MIIRKKRKKKKTRISPGVIAIICVLLIAISAALFLILRSGREETAEAGTLMFTLKGKNAVLIRDEYTYLSSELASIDYHKEERELVSSGDSLATVYKLGYNDELMQSLLNAREEVYRAQIERIGSTKDAKLDEFNESIDEINKRIEECVMMRSGEDLESLYRELDAVLDERMEYLRGKVQETENLRALYASVDAKEELLSTWTEDVTADRDGRISYYFDGYEQAVNVEKLGMLSADLINRAVKDSGQYRLSSDDKTRVCRVVNENKWYIAFVTKGDSLTRLASGLEYDVNVTGYGSFKGTAKDPFVSGDQIVNLIEFNSPIGELIEVRTVKIDVSASMSGVKVKARSIDMEKNMPYLELVLTESHRSIRVDVLAVDDKYAIVRPHNANDTLTEGVRYWNRKR